MLPRGRHGKKDSRLLKGQVRCDYSCLVLAQIGFLMSCVVSWLLGMDIA